MTYAVSPAEIQLGIQAQIVNSDVEPGAIDRYAGSDPTGTTVSDTALATMIAVNSIANGFSRFGPGLYRFNSVPAIDGPMTFIGAGRATTLTPGPAFMVTDSKGGQVDDSHNNPVTSSPPIFFNVAAGMPINVDFRDLDIDCSQFAAGGTCIAYDMAMRCTIRDVCLYVPSGGTGIYTQECGPILIGSGVSIWGPTTPTAPAYCGVNAQNSLVVLDMPDIENCSMPWNAGGSTKLSVRDPYLVNCPTVQSTKRIRVSGWFMP